METETSAQITASIKAAILHKLQYLIAKPAQRLTTNDWYLAFAHAVRDQMVGQWAEAGGALLLDSRKLVSYLSAEFLLGPHLGNNLLSLGIQQEARQALEELGQNLDAILTQEEEPGLGNGGLGRLAACYLDSLATLGVPAIGYGIRYEFGIFDQRIVDGWQMEITDEWLRLGNPWEIHRPEHFHYVGFGGSTSITEDGVQWTRQRVVKGVAYDTPILGYKGVWSNILRLWKGEAVESFDFQSFNVGDYYGAVEAKVHSENITKVLYPNDESMQGKQLRLEQQYFFVSCSLQDMMDIHVIRNGHPEEFHQSWAVQLNDTHPAIGVAELMRLLVDEHGVDWDTAWACTRRTFSYTNHTLLPEALEKWSVDLFGSLLPRHLEIIYEINRRFLDEVRAAFPGDEARIQRMSLIQEGPQRMIRMAHLATVGGGRVNGVAAIHSDLVASRLLRDFAEMEPDKFINVTNGVTPRRWVAMANPGLAALITSRIGDAWLQDTQTELLRLEEFAGDPAFRRQWRAIKLENKRLLAANIFGRTGLEVDNEALFDIQVKRIHEYKRQHLNVLHILTLYNRLKRDPGCHMVPRVFIFGGKAAPGYVMAKLIIKLINAVGEVVNQDPDVAGRLKVVFLPDYNVKNSMPVYPAADLSEQTSTAGKEASGTGNMKFTLNGALTIGTLDGANVEIREKVGPENFFLFGMNVDQVEQLWARGYSPRSVYENDGELRTILDQLLSGAFSRGDRELFRPLVDSLLNHDPYLLLADYRSYIECQERVSDAWLDQDHWAAMSILNVARSGFFSSDRSIREYCRNVWNVPVGI